MARYTLKQAKGGEWTAKMRDLPNVVISEPTPNEAAKAAEDVLAVFDTFVRHLYRECDPTACEHCESKTAQYPPHVKRRNG